MDPSWTNYISPLASPGDIHSPGIINLVNCSSDGLRLCQHMNQAVEFNLAARKSWERVETTVCNPSINQVITKENLKQFIGSPFQLQKVFPKFKDRTANLFMYIHLLHLLEGTPHCIKGGGDLETIYYDTFPFLLVGSAYGFGIEEVQPQISFIPSESHTAPYLIVTANTKPIFVTCDGVTTSFSFQIYGAPYGTSSRIWITSTSFVFIPTATFFYES